MTSWLETLETRLLMSVSIKAGTLRIVGTAGDDQIQVTHPLVGPGLLRPDTSRTLVNFNGEQFSFKTKRIKAIKINGGDGNDRIELGEVPFFCNLCGMPVSWPPDPYPFEPAIPTLLVGGAGADYIVGGNGRDRIFGGDGNDYLHGSSGNDLLDGAEGDDGLTGGAGNDLLIGAAGNDVLDGRQGNDILIAGTGDDTLYAGSAADFLSGGDGDDLLRFPIYGDQIEQDPVTGEWHVVEQKPPFDVPSDIERVESFLDVAMGSPASRK